MQLSSTKDVIIFTGPHWGKSIPYIYIYRHMPEPFLCHLRQMHFLIYFNSSVTVVMKRFDVFCKRVCWAHPYFLWRCCSRNCIFLYLKNHRCKASIHFLTTAVEEGTHIDHNIRLAYIGEERVEPHRLWPSRALKIKSNRYLSQRFNTLIITPHASLLKRPLRSFALQK